MKRIHSLLSLAVIGLAVVSIMFVKNRAKINTNTGLTIGILQTASHPALDAARNGFINALKEKLGTKVNFIIRNAEGSVANAHTIAQSFHADSTVQGIFAIATPATQAAAAVERKKPIFIAAVTDPEALGIMHPTTNITGSSDMIDVNGTVEMLKKLVPTARTVAILFTTGELNAVRLAQKMEESLQAAGLTPIKVGVSNQAEMSTAVETALRKADVLLTPTDNNVASAITLIADRALKAKKPLIVSDNLLVKEGALAARGVNYEESGRQAGHRALQVLVEHKKPFELPIAQPQNSTAVINRSIAQALEITIPEDLGNVDFISQEHHE